MNFIECPKCKKEIQDDFLTCPYCKTKIKANNSKPKTFNLIVIIMIISLCLNVFQTTLYFKTINVTEITNDAESSPIKNTLENDKNNAINAEYNIEWVNGEEKFTFGSETSIAEVLGASVVKSNDGNYLLVIDFTYTNTLEDSRNFINDTYCNVMTFQNGIELDSPGITSEGDLYNYTDAYTQIKKGASIQTQLVWELKDTINPIEIEFGWGDAIFIKTLNIVKNNIVKDFT